MSDPKMSNTKTKERAAYRRHIRINGKLISRRFLRRADADRWYLEQKREKELIENGIKPATLELTPLHEFAERWMLTRKAHGKPESSWRTDERRLRLHILPKMGERHLQQVTRREWEEYLDRLVTKEKMHPATRNRVQALLCKLYNDALRQEVVTANPLAMIPKVRESSAAWDYWQSKQECASYLEVSKVEGESFQIYAMLALNTGARVGELLALRHEDVNLETRTIHIWRTYEQETKTIVERTKGRSARYLGINDALYEALAQHRKGSRRSRPGDLVIYQEGIDSRDTVPQIPMTEWMIRHRHLRTCARAQLKPIRVHDLRHTYASHYMMSGGNLSDLQSLLGHSSPEMTRKYAHLSPGHLQSKSKVVSFSGTVPHDPLPPQQSLAQNTELFVPETASNVVRFEPRRLRAVND